MRRAAAKVSTGHSSTFAAVHERLLDWNAQRAIPIDSQLASCAPEHTATIGRLCFSRGRSAKIVRRLRFGQFEQSDIFEFASAYQNVTPPRARAGHLHKLDSCRECCSVIM